MFEVKRGRLGDGGLLRDGCRAAQAPPRLGDRRRGALVGGIDPAVLIDEGAGDDRQLVAEMVEDDQQRR